jgi:hypothetical protein
MVEPSPSIMSWMKPMKMVMVAPTSTTTMLTMPPGPRMFSGKPSAFTVKGGSMPMNHASTPVPMMVPAASTAEKT